MGKNIFSETDFLSALESLDSRVGSNPTLLPYLPLQLISSGGFVSVMLLKNRASTADLDYFLRPSTPASVRAALLQEIEAVGFSLGYVSKWCNDEVTWFLTLLNDPNDLFDRSMAQDQRLFIGQNLHIRAVLWDWVLVSKMQRLQSFLPGKKEDLFDCAEIARVMYINRYGQLIGKDVLQAFDDTDRAPPIFRSTAEIVGNYSVGQGGKFPFDLEGLPEN